MAKKKSKVRQAKVSGCLVVGFFGIFALAGAATFYFMAVRPIAGILAARTWHETQCAIVSSRVAESSSSDGSTYSVEMTYDYEYDWQTYRGDRYDFSIGSTSGYAGKAAVVEAHPPGAEVACYVDPDDPTRSVINRSPGGYLWWGLFPLPFLAVGLGGLFFFFVAAASDRAPRRFWRRVASLRRRREAASARLWRETSARLRRDGSSTRSRAPGVSGVGWASEAAERHGTLELEAGQSPTAKLIHVIVFATLWNGIVSLFVFFVILPSFERGDPEWLVTIFMVPFILIGLATIGGVVYQLLALFNPRPHLTLADGHLTPGAEVELSWQLVGPAWRIRSFSIELEGREAASYRSGKNTRTDHHVFYAEQVLSETGLGHSGTQHRGAQHRGRVALRIPEPTLPSFDAGHNKIEWRLKVRGDVPVWPDVSQDFPVTVFPA